MVTRHIFAEELTHIAAQQDQPGAGDYKTQFQEWCQKRHDTLPAMRLFEKQGRTTRSYSRWNCLFRARSWAWGPGGAKRKQNNRRRNKLSDK